MTNMWAYGVKKEFSKEVSKIPHESRKPSDGISLIEWRNQDRKKTKLS